MIPVLFFKTNEPLLGSETVRRSKSGLWLVGMIADGVFSEKDDSDGGVDVAYRSRELLRTRDVSLATRGVVDTGAEMVRWIAGGFLDDCGLLLAVGCDEVDGKDDAGDGVGDDTVMEWPTLFMNSETSLVSCSSSEDSFNASSCLKYSALSSWDICATISNAYLAQNRRTYPGISQKEIQCRLGYSLIVTRSKVRLNHVDHGAAEKIERW